MAKNIFLSCLFAYLSAFTSFAEMSHSSSLLTDFSHLVSAKRTSQQSFPAHYVRLKSFSSIHNFSSCFLTAFNNEEPNCRPWNKWLLSHSYYDASRRYLFSASQDKYLHVIDVDFPNKQKLLNTKKPINTNIVPSSDKTILAFGTQDNTLIFIDAYTFKILGYTQLDSLINSDLLFIDNAVYCSTTLGTVYKVTQNGKIQWKATRPVSQNRLVLKPNSNILYYQGFQTDYILVPHSSGYISQIEAKSGKITQVISLPGHTKLFNKGYPDIVAPMHLQGDSLFVASYDLGLFKINIQTGQIIIHRKKLKKITQLSTVDNDIIIAGNNNLVRLDQSLEPIWQMSLSEFITPKESYVFPFSVFFPPEKPLFQGRITDILVAKNSIFLTSSLGGLGIFSLATGELQGIKAPKVGLGPMTFDGKSLYTISKAGSLLIYSF